MRRPLFSVCLCLVAFIAVWMALSGRFQNNADASIDPGAAFFSEGDHITVTGQIYQKEIRTSYNREIVILYLKSVSIQKINQSDVNIQYSSYLICEMSGDDMPAVGSNVQISGQAYFHTAATNPGEFDSREYYRILGVGCQLKKAELLTASHTGFYLREVLHNLKHYWKNRIYECFPEKEASIITTMILGDKTSLDSEIKELYKRNGIIHILSISGLHITIIGMGIYRLLRKAGCPRILAAVTGGVILVLFGIMTGMAVSACRAIGMYLIRMLGECIGRTYDMLTAMGVMAVVILMRQPEYLKHSGFLLSFGSIFGIGLLSPALLTLFHGSKKSKTITKWSSERKQKCKKQITNLLKGLKQSLLTGLSVTLFTLPVHLWFYNELPVYSLFLNILILPFMSIIMNLSLAVMLIPGTGFLGNIVTCILSSYEMLCTFCESLPFHTWIAGRPEAWQTAAYYGMIVTFLIYTALHDTGRHNQLKKLKTLICRDISKIIWLLAAVLLISIRIRSDTIITFLDVGQGDGICIQTDDNMTFLIDGGSSSKSQIGKYILIPFLKHQGIDQIDAIFVTHPDEDHINGILELLTIGHENGITVSSLILPAIAEEKRTEELKELIETARDNMSGINIQYIAAGNTFQSGSFRFTCLHPPEGYTTNETNAYSLCFFAESENFSMLLTGDVEGNGERMLLKELETRGIRDITLLKVAHHGSRNSTSDNLLNQLEPRLSVISCGKNNSYGHPHEELLQRLSQAETYIMKTTDMGAIQIRIDKGKITVEGFRGDGGGINPDE